MPRELTAKQEAFVREYLSNGRNATAAYKAAYHTTSDNVAAASGAKLLRNAKVAARVAAVVQVAAEETQVDVSKVIRELWRIGSADPRRLFRPDGTLKPPQEWDERTAAVVASVEALEEFEGAGEARKQTGTTRKVRCWPKVEALKTLLRHLAEATGPAAPALPQGIHVHIGITIEQFRALPVEERLRLLRSALPLPSGN